MIGLPSVHVRLVLERLQGVRGASSGQWTARCPSHEDHNASLSIGQKADGGVLLKCFAGCTYEQILAALEVTPIDVGPSQDRPTALRPVPRATPQPPAGLTLEALAAAKRLPVDFLATFDVSDFKLHGRPVVKIEYPGVAGEVASAVRYRLALTGDRRFLWRSGDKVSPYPLDKITEIRKRGWCLIGEGESDAWTAWFHDIPFLGVPGKTIWNEKWARLLEGVAVVVWQEPKAEDFTERVARTLPELSVIQCAPFKDLSEAHIAGEDIPALIDRLRSQARSWSAIQAERAATRRSELLVEAQPVLEHPDPLALVEAELRRQGYGGEPGPAMIVYLALTSRLLAMRPGNMPVHLLLVATSSGGKTYTVDVVLRLMPTEAHHTITAGSPRALIYDDAPLVHRALIFGEADSLPAGEDNPAASAIRSLLQDNELNYHVVVRDAETSDYVTRHIHKPGPTVMVTTSTRRLPGQLDTRVFSLDLPEDLPKIRAALMARARLSRTPPPDPDSALVAFQALLQTSAPWDVDVPYLEPLAELIAKSARASRILRDFSRLTAFIQSVAVLRHAHRARSSRGWVMATLEDYDTVRQLIGSMYADTVSGASDGVRRVVQAVAEVTATAGATCNLQRVCTTLGAGVNKGSVSRWVRAACEHGWLANRAPGKQTAYDLIVGEPMPEWTGLPETAALADQGGCGVAGPTGRNTGDGPAEALAPASIEIEL